VEVDVPGPSAYGALSLGLIQENQGDLEGATSSYGRALALGAQPHADWALNNLGVLAERLHDDDLAERLYRRAMESEEVDVACRAAFKLGVMQRARGLTDGARESLQRAVETGGADADNARRELEALSNAT
jgi:tetratricopeptide (TPR) repeat protein